ncbi:MAG: hypothetical protein HFJ33_01260 [Clostridia bacterium]|nr:hypothetical protein [Clostridia bacterium]
MTKEELIRFLEKEQGTDIVLNLQGIMIGSLLIKCIQIRQKEKILILENKKNPQEGIGFNMSQLMKITRIQKNEILLEFDPLQKVTIKTKDKIKEAMNLVEK